MAAEKIRRERWVRENTKKIKVNSVMSETQTSQKREYNFRGKFAQEMFAFFFLFCLLIRYIIL